MGKKAKEWLYTDSPPKFTPNKLIVNFLECVAARAKSRTRSPRKLRRARVLYKQLDLSRGGCLCWKYVKSA